MSDWKVEFASDSSLRVAGQSGDAIGAAFERLRDDWDVINLHPAYETLTLDFDPLLVSPPVFKARIEALLETLDASQAASPRTVEIPVRYGGTDGPDLEDVARLTKLDPAEVVRLHTAPLYTVRFLGFAPGFPYLTGLATELECARRESPRTRVPAGSVAIAARQTGIYPEESPGGWQILGRTETELFSPERERPTLLTPGDRVKFVAIEVRK